MSKMTRGELKNMLPEKRRAYEKRRKKVMRNRRIFASFIALTVLLITVIVLSLTVFFNIDSVVVEGTSRYDDQQIIKASGVEKGANLFLTDISSAKAHIEKNLPYISDAKVSRKLPSSIVISVESAEAEYCFETKSGMALADGNGKVLEIVSEDAVPEGAALIKTKSVLFGEIGQKFEADDKDDLELLNTVFTSISDSGIKDITQIDVSVPASIYLTYQNRFRLNIGTTNELTYKLKSAVEIIKKEDEINTSTSGEIFLSNPGSAYVTLDSASGTGNKQQQ